MLLFISSCVDNIFSHSKVYSKKCFALECICYELCVGCCKEGEQYLASKLCLSGPNIDSVCFVVGVWLN